MWSNGKTSCGRVHVILSNLSLLLRQTESFITFHQLAWATASDQYPPNRHRICHSPPWNTLPTHRTTSPVLASRSCSPYHSASSYSYLLHPINFPKNLNFRSLFNLDTTGMWVMYFSFFLFHHTGFAVWCSSLCGCLLIICGAECIHLDISLHQHSGNEGTASFGSDNQLFKADPSLRVRHPEVKTPSRIL